MRAQIGGSVKPGHSKPECRALKLEVLVVGMLPSQAGEISSSLGLVFKLRFWKDESTQRLRNLCSTCDVAYLMTKFVSHSAQIIVKRYAADVRFANGGVSDTTRLLNALYEEVK